jgi:hypothetical protein
MCGGLTFISVYVVFSYMWVSIWRSESDKMIAYVFLFMVLLAIIVSELGIMCTYINLRQGNYRW